MTITKYRPTKSLLRDMFSPVGFDSMMNDFFAENSRGNEFQPLVDVIENDQNYDIHASIPGVKKSEITLDVKDSVLTISGERKEVNESDESNMLVNEIRYGKFSRTFYLPEIVNREKIEARFEDGILHVVIPKAEKAKPKSITIK